MGLDKDPGFLQDIQSFWEQSLLKRVLKVKKSELTSVLNVKESEIVAFYNKHVDVAYKDRLLSDVRDQIYQILKKEKQQSMIKKWIDSLDGAARIEVDYKKLGMPDKNKFSH